MNKILVFLRVSTESQDLQEQKNEMIEFVGFNGYNEDDIIFLEEKGASAIKLNDKYLEMVDTLLSYIEKREVSCVAIWSVNRMLRDEEIYPKIKKALVQNKVQLLIKNPSLALLNPDGSINQGSELALSLFSTMATQEMRERKEKFRRTKRAYAKQGKWAGGRTRKFGYRVDANQFFVEDENDGEIVRTAFQLYSTGEYSAESLAVELVERGYKRGDGLPINTSFLIRLLASKSYTGEPDEKNNMRVYPPLITHELFDTCRKIASGNKLVMRTGERIVMGAKLLKCKECGGTYTSNSRHFHCCGNISGKCTNNLTIRQFVVDTILWRTAFECHMEYLLDLNESKSKTYAERIDVIDRKISSLNMKIDEVEDRKKRIIDTYLEGYIDKKTRDLRLSKINDDTHAHHQQINALQEERSAILGLLKDMDKEIEELKYFNALDIVENSVKTDKDRYDIIHKHILKVVPERLSYGKRDPRTTRPNAVLFTIYAVSGKEYKYMFFPKHYQGFNLYCYDNEKDIWLKEDITLPDNIYRKKGAE